MTRLEKLATAIKKHEGYFEGSKAFVNNNPGNLRFDAYRQSLGADYENLAFAHFPTYEIGWKALLTLLRDSIEGKRKGLPYSKEQTMPEFFGVYSFIGWLDKASGKRMPNMTYSDAVAKDLDININTRMGWFLEDSEPATELEVAKAKLAKIKDILNS